MNENATLPTYGSLHAAGADLYSSEECTIPAKGKFSGELRLWNFSISNLQKYSILYYSYIHRPLTKKKVTGKFCVSTSIQVAIPSGCYGRVAPRSGLAAKHFIGVGAGVIDSDYRGEVKVLLFNFGEEDYQVSFGFQMA